MKTVSSNPNKSDSEWDFDPFAEPKGMSVGWDLSNLPTNSQSKTNGRDLTENLPAGSDQTSDTTANAESAVETHPEAEFDPFPEPRTVPANWDVSALV